jgi:hypothetical protein
VALADLAAREGELAAAAQLLGAAARLRGAEDPTALNIARLTRELTAALGADGFGAEYGVGYARSHDDAIALFGELVRGHDR